MTSYQFNQVNGPCRGGSIARVRAAAAFVLAMFALTLSAAAQTTVQINLSEFGAIPATNRLVTVQQLEPFPANLQYYLSDTNGNAYVSNCAAADYATVITATNGAFAIRFQFTVQSTNLGVVDAYQGGLLTVSGVQTYPTAGQSAYTVQAANQRFALGTNGGSYATLQQATNAAQFWAYLVGLNDTNNLNSTDALYQAKFASDTNFARTRQAGSFALTNLAATGAFTNGIGATNGVVLYTNAQNQVVVGATNQTQLTNGMTSIVFLTPGTFQGSSGVLTNLAGTGAFTNGLANTGTNIVVTTNAGQVVLEVPWQVNLTNGQTSIVLSNPSTSFYLYGNPSNFVTLPLASSTYYPTSNPSQFLTQPNAAATYYPTSNPSGFISSVPSGATNGFASSNAVNSLIGAYPTVAIAATNLVQTNSAPPVFVLAGHTIFASTNLDAAGTALVYATAVSNNAAQLYALGVSNTASALAASTAYSQTNPVNYARLTNVPALYSGSTATNSFYAIQNPSNYVPLAQAQLLFYPTSNPSGFLNTNQATATYYPTSNPSQFLPAQVVTNVAFQQATNQGNASTNNEAALFAASLLVSTNLYGQSTNYANTNGQSVYSAAANFAQTNAAAQIQQATNVAYNFVAETNGVASVLTLKDSLVVGTKTNLNLSTNNIGVVGLAGGTYVTAAFGSTWTNAFNTNMWILQSGGFFFLQTNAVTNAETLYQFGPELGQGVVINGGFPAPTASYGVNYGFDGNVLKGWVYSTNIAAQILSQTAAAASLVANSLVSGRYGLLQTNSAGTNALSVDTNVIASRLYVQTAIAGLGGTNAGTTGTQVTNIVDLLVPQLAFPLNFPLSTNFMYTNVQAVAPQVSGGTLFVFTNAGGGSGLTVFGFTNAYPTNVPGVITSGGTVFVSTNYPSLALVNAAIVNFANNVAMGGALSGVATNAGFSAAGTNAVAAIAASGSQFVAVTNGTGVGTTISNGSFVVVSNLTAVQESYLNNSNLNAYSISSALSNSLVPFMTSTNTPYGAAVPSANTLGNNANQAYRPFGGNSTGWAPSASQGWVEYNFTGAVTVSGMSFLTSGSTQSGVISFEYSTDGANYLLITNDNIPNLALGGATNSFGAISGVISLRWAFTNNDSSMSLHNILVGGPSWINTTNINFVDSTVQQLEILAPNGAAINTAPVPTADLTLNGGLVAGGGLQAGNIVTPGNVSASQYLLNGKLINFSTNQLSTITEVTIGGVLTNGLASQFYSFTNVNGNYFLNVPASAWTNANGSGSTIYPFGQSGSQTTWLIATNSNQGLPPLWVRSGGVSPGDAIGTYSPAQRTISTYGITYTLRVSVAGVSTNALLPGTTLTSTNGAVTFLVSTNANQTLNYDVTAASGGSGSQVFYIANEGSSFNTATRPAVQYDSLGGWWVKTNATTDNAGWMQMQRDAGD